MKRLFIVLGIVFALSGSFPFIAHALGEDPAVCAQHASANGSYACTLPIDGATLSGTCDNTAAIGDSTKNCQFQHDKQTVKLECGQVPGADGSVTTLCQLIKPDGSSVVYSTNPGILNSETGIDPKGNVTNNQYETGAGQAVGWVAGLLGGSIAWIVLKVLTALISFLIQVALFLLYIVASVFDVVVQNLVIGMGGFINSSSSTGIQTAWQVIRDLANIGIIGGMIMIAISTILQIEKYSASKLLARLIIAALLVNFSYFFAGAIIDSSNYLATQIYKQTVCPAQATCTNTIAGRFYDLVQIQRITSLDFATRTESTDHNNTTEELKVGNAENQSIGGQIASSALSDFAHYLLFFVLICVTTFVLLSSIALLIGRFVSLIFLLIASPIGIAGSAIPGVGKYAGQWWNILFAQAFFAPIYFLLVGFSLDMLKGLTLWLSVINPLFNYSSRSSDPTAGTVITFIIATTFMLLSLKIAKQMSESGKEYLGDFYKGAQKVTGWMPKMYTTGLKFGGAVVGRNTVGAAAFKANEAYRKFAAKNDLANPKKGFLINSADRYLQETLHKTADKKFLGFNSYDKERQERRSREALLGEVKREEEQNEKYKEASAEAVSKEKAVEREVEEGKKKKIIDDPKVIDPKTGKPKEREETDDEYWARQALRSHKTRIKDPVTGKERWETEKEVLDRLGIASASELMTRDAKTKKLRAMTLDELKKSKKPALVALVDRAKLIVGKDKDGKDILETDHELTDRLENGLGRQFKDGQGEDTHEYEERLDKMDNLDTETHKGSYRDARAKAGGIFATFTNDFIKRQYEEHPESILAYARWAPYDKFKQIQEDKSIRRDLRDEMAEQRWMKHARKVYNIQKQVDEGKIIEFGESYNTQMLDPYQYMQNNMKVGTEFEDYLRSTGLLKDEYGNTVIGKDGQPIKFEDLRDMRAMQHSYSSTKFVDIKDQKIFEPTEQRNMNSDKRKTVTNLRDEWTAIQIAKGYGNNGWIVPNIGGTTNALLERRGKVFVQKQMEAMQKVIDNTDSDSERADAKRQLSYLEKEAQGMAALESDPAIVAIREQVKGSFPDPNVDENSEDFQKKFEEKKDELFRERKKQLLQDFSNNTTEERNAILAERKSNLDDLLNREIIIEGGYDPKNPTGIPGWYKGKNVEKELGVLGKRELVSPPMIYGMEVDTFASIYRAGHDKVEKDLFWQETLIRGNPQLLKNIFNTDDLSSLVSLPEGELFEEINRERIRLYGPQGDLKQIVKGTRASRGDPAHPDA